MQELKSVLFVAILLLSGYGLLGCGQSTDERAAPETPLEFVISIPEFVYAGDEVRPFLHVTPGDIRFDSWEWSCDVPLMEPAESVPAGSVNSILGIAPPPVDGVSQPATLTFKATDEFGRSAEASASFTILPERPVTQALELEVEFRTFATVEVLLRSFSTRGIVLTVPGANPLDPPVEHKPVQQERSIGIAVPLTLSIQPGATLPLKVRYADQSAEHNLDYSLELASVPLPLSPGAIYALPLKTRATVGEAVPIAILQGEPDAPIESLSLLIDCGGSARPAIMNFDLGLPGGDEYVYDGAWTSRWASARLGIPFPPAGYVASENGQPSLMRLEIGSGLDRLAQARSGVLGTFEVRYSRPGTYTVRPQRDARNYYQGEGPERYDWRSYLTDIPGAAQSVTIE